MPRGGGGGEQGTACQCSAERGAPGGSLGASATGLWPWAQGSPSRRVSPEGWTQGSAVDAEKSTELRGRQAWLHPALPQPSPPQLLAGSVPAGPVCESRQSTSQPRLRFLCRAA